jgi:ribosomal protein S13
MVITKKKQLVDIKSIKVFGVNNIILKKVYNLIGLNSRLRFIHLKKKHLNSINVKIKKNYKTGKNLKNQLNDLSTFKFDLKVLKNRS